MVYLTCQGDEKCVQVQFMDWRLAQQILGLAAKYYYHSSLLPAWCLLSTSLLDCGQLRNQAAFPPGCTRTVCSLQAHAQQKTSLVQEDNSFSSLVSLPTPWMSRLKDLSPGVRQPSVRTYCRSPGSPSDTELCSLSSMYIQAEGSCSSLELCVLSLCSHIGHVVVSLVWPAHARWAIMSLYRSSSCTGVLHTDFQKPKRPIHAVPSQNLFSF